MKRFAVILGLSVLFFCTGSIAQTGRERLASLSDFDALHVGAAINVVISDSYRNVEIECTPTMFQRLDIDVVNNVLNIGLRPGTNVRTSRITVYLPMRAYRHIKAMSATKVDIHSPITTENIIFDMSSAARITGAVNANEVQIFTNSASRITLNGTANTVRVESSSSSRVESHDLISRKAVCNSTSAARVSVYAFEWFTGDASSASRIDCYGNPEQKQTNTSSAGKINFR